MGSLYKRIGEQPALEGLVYFLYQKMLEDDRVRHHFEKVDMPVQRCKMFSYLAKSFGNDLHWTDYDLRAAHAHMQLEEDDFDAVVEHLTSTLEQVGVGDPAKSEILSVIVATKWDILNLPTK